MLSSCEERLETERADSETKKVEPKRRLWHSRQLDWPCEARRLRSTPLTNRSAHCGTTVAEGVVD
jgi:hypothetical protein